MWFLLVLSLMCPEKGWAFGVEIADGDSIKVAVHGPFSAFGRQVWFFADSTIKVAWDTRRAWNVEQRVDVTFYRRVHNAGFDPYYGVMQEYELKMRDLRCRFASKKLPSGNRFVLSNLQTLNHSSHLKHYTLEGPETMP